MDVPASRQRIKNESYNKAKRPYSLQFYRQPPTENISLQEFEDLAVARVKVLKSIETLGIRHVKGTESYMTEMRNEMRSLKKQIGNVLEDADKDNISHFILRLAYCKSDDLRRWFITQELDLFKFRFHQETKDRRRFLKENNLHFTPISESEKNTMQPLLQPCLHNVSDQIFASKEYYKVPFTDVLDLVKSRRVYLSEGQAYITQDELVIVVMTAFRAHLSHSLALTARAVPEMEEDERLIKLLRNIHHLYLGTDYTANTKKEGTVTADMIHGLSKESFPPCMQNLHSGLQQTHHLKHWGRLQYGLFLKAIGLSLDEAMRFWRTEFTKGPAIDVDKFDKQYSYNVRHMYGKEGKRANYTPYSCVKIITTNAPATGDYHGCPFRHSEPALLQQRLQAININKDSQDKILGLVKGSHCQLACMEYFKSVHRTDCNFDLSHPNQYFEESQRIRHGGDTPSQNENSSSQANRGTPRIVKVKKEVTEARDDFEDFTDAEMIAATQ